MSRVYFSSDHHFYHANIIKFCDRPYKDVISMNEALVRNWNEVVAPEDVVYYLGDFSMAFRSVELYSARLNGTKYLVAGNHDHCHSYHKRSRTPEKRDLWAYKYLEHGWKVFPEQAIVEVEGILLQLCHLPYLGDVPVEQDKFEKWRPEPVGESALLCGHVHEKWQTKKLNSNLMINVGCDVWDYKPVSLEKIIELIKANDEG